MPEDFRFRTEDFKPEELQDQYVEGEQERLLIAQLKAPSPLVLEGSRGTGKSFLMRMAEIELWRDFETERIVPVYLSFLKSSLIYTRDPHQFHNWMLAKLCSSVLKSLKKAGMVSPNSSAFRVLTGNDVPPASDSVTELEALVSQYESSYMNPGMAVVSNKVPDIQTLKDGLEEIAEHFHIKRFAIFFDEAIHVFKAEQQRQFFTIFRDLRSPYIGCNAAVYPGVTSYGPVFELTHDATRKRITRDITASDYVSQMREIVLKQSDEDLTMAIERNGENFAILAYAATGNPRILLKTLAQANRLRASDVTETIRTFYRSTIWAEHSALANSYEGQKFFVDWGRNFLENVVLPETKQKNDKRKSEGTKESTCTFWIHRNAPEGAKHGLRLLEYTGIVQKGEDGIRGTRSEIGTRYQVNVGCLLALEANPAITGFDIAQHLSIKRFSEFGANNSAYPASIGRDDVLAQAADIEILQAQLAKPISKLDISHFQRTQLEIAGYNTIGSVLRADEWQLQSSLDYVGPVRARQIKNAANVAVLEYLSG